MNLERHLDVAIHAAKVAGNKILHGYLENDFGTEFKEDGTPVTQIDKQAEEDIQKILCFPFRDHGFQGEESESREGTDGYCWHVDPLDGTWSILNGEKTVSTSIGLSEGEKMVLGVVYNPFTDELFSGTVGVTTFLNNDPIPKYQKDRPKDAVVNFQISPDYKSKVDTLFDLWGEKKIGKLISPGGSIAYNLAQVAEGRHGAYIVSSSGKSNLWDIAAGMYLVESVGGKVEQFDEGRTLIASNNKQMHDQMMMILERADFLK